MKAFYKKNRWFRKPIWVELPIKVTDGQTYIDFSGHPISTTTDLEIKYEN